MLRLEGANSVSRLFRGYSTTRFSITKVTKLVIQQDFASCFKSVLLYSWHPQTMKKFSLFIHVWNLVGRFLREGKNEQRKNNFFFLEQDQMKDIQMTFWPLRVTREAYNFFMLYQSLIKNKGIDPQRGSWL